MRGRGHPSCANSAAIRILVCPIRQAIPSPRPPCCRRTYEPAPCGQGNIACNLRPAPPAQFVRRLQSSLLRSLTRPCAQRMPGAAFFLRVSLHANAKSSCQRHPFEFVCAPIQAAAPLLFHAQLPRGRLLRKPSPTLRSCRERVKSPSIAPLFLLAHPLRCTWPVTQTGSLRPSCSPSRPGFPHKVSVFQFQRFASGTPPRARSRQCAANSRELPPPEFVSFLPAL